MKIFFLLFCTFFFISCTQNDKQILSPVKMENILWDITQADIFTQDYLAKDSSKNLTAENLKLQQKIFAKHKTDKATFYKSYEYYIKHEELLKPILDSMVVKQGRIKESKRLKTVMIKDE